MGSPPEQEICLELSQTPEEEKEKKRNDSRVLDPTCGLCNRSHTAKHERVES
jgi:hypothetical protein